MLTTLTGMTGRRIIGALLRDFKETQGKRMDLRAMDLPAHHLDLPRTDRAHGDSAAASMRPRAILFDMDGTLTQPLLDFAQIKREMGITDGMAILEAVVQLAEPHRSAAREVLLRHEDHAAQNSMLNEGCRELLGWLSEHGVRVALVTRNSRRSADVVMRKHALPFQVLITRDDDCAYKPDPAPLVLACQRLSVSHADTWMVGDGRHDIQAGHAAQMRTVWISHGRERDFTEEPWRIARDLVELHTMLRACRA
jgi:HAD superfamily hydrolase (TIGR01549 family)